MTDEGSNIVRLAVVNNSVETDGDAARALVVEFLRDWANSIEDGSEDVTKAVLVLYNDAPNNLFRIRTRRCNVDLVNQIGMMQLATIDLCTATEVGKG